MKRMKVLLCMLLASGGVVAQNNKLHKVFHHRRGEQNIEVGSVAFYFAQNPTLEMLKATQNAHGQEERVFLFKGAGMQTAEIKKMVQEFNTTSHALYSVKIEQDAKEHAVKFVVRYNPNTIDLQYDSFESVGLEKGLVFRFFNKQLVNRIKEKRTCILTTACAKKVPGIVIDCGHGGHDSGAGIDGFFEKNLTMSVGLEVASLLKKKGFQVFLTRSTDNFVPLDERTSVANALNADLFVSIHANFAANKNAAGLETYCLHERLFKPQYSTLDAQAQRAVAEHCGNSMKQGLALAETVHKTIIAHAGKKNSRIADRKIAHAVTQVLLGSQAPSVLIELGFLSNPYEASLLQDGAYQQLLARAICEGVAEFTKINA